MAQDLSQLLHNAKASRYIEGIKVPSTKEITHALFVDDVLVFGKGSIRNIRAFSSLWDNYKKATSMVISIEKSSLVYNEFSAKMIQSAKEIVHFPARPNE